MKQLQKITNDKERVCDNVECQTMIKIGDKTIVEYHSKVFGGNKYYHDTDKKRCYIKDL